MSRLQLSVAIGAYDRVRPIHDGDVLIDGADPVFLFLEPEEIFFRAFRFEEFDVCELSLSSYTLRTAAGTCPYVAVPVFPSRAFRHTAITVRTDRIRRPEDLKGRRVGIPEYQLTANVWARALLADEFGVQPSDLNWVQGGLEQPALHPVQVRGLHPELVGEQGSRPDVGGQLVLGDADPLALQVLGPGDAAVGADVDGGVAESPRGEHRNADVRAVAARRSQRKGRQRQLADVERLLAEGAEEDLLRLQVHEDRRAAVDPHAPLRQRPHPVVIPDRNGELQAHRIM